MGHWSTALLIFKNTQGLFGESQAFASSNGNNGTQIKTSKEAWNHSLLAIYKVTTPLFFPVQYSLVLSYTSETQLKSES